MTTKLEQAARQASDMMEFAAKYPGVKSNSANLTEVSQALREALAEQAEQEPVGYFAYDEEHDIWEELTGPNAPGATKLYAAPVSIAKQSETDSSSSSMRTTVRTKDLTDDEIEALFDNEENWTCDRWSYERAVIAADRKKNK